MSEGCRQDVCNLVRQLDSLQNFVVTKASVGNLCQERCTQVNICQSAAEECTVTQCGQLGVVQVLNSSEFFATLKCAGTDRSGLSIQFHSSKNLTALELIVCNGSHLCSAEVSSSQFHEVCESRESSDLGREGNLLECSSATCKSRISSDVSDVSTSEQTLLQFRACSESASDSSQFRASAQVDCLDDG